MHACTGCGCERYTCAVWLRQLVRRRLGAAVALTLCIPHVAGLQACAGALCIICRALSVCVWLCMLCSMGGMLHPTSHSTHLPMLHSLCVHMLVSAVACVLLLSLYDCSCGLACLSSVRCHVQTSCNKGCHQCYPPKVTVQILWYPMLCNMCGLCSWRCRGACHLVWPEFWQLMYCMPGPLYRRGLTLVCAARTPAVQETVASLHIESAVFG
jgi:hypothetical protein